MPRDDEQSSDDLLRHDCVRRPIRFPLLRAATPR